MPAFASTSSPMKKLPLQWLCGVRMHWMVDWGMPFPLFIDEAKGAMFGYAPKAIADCLAREGARGPTTRLPRLMPLSTKVMPLVDLHQYIAGGDIVLIPH